MINAACGPCDACRELVTPGAPFGNVHIRTMMLAQKGQIVRGHRHWFDHVTYVVRGAVKLTVRTPEGALVGESRHVAPARVLVKAGLWHEFEALEDHTLADCIFALRDDHGCVTDTWTGDAHPYIEREER